MKILMNYLRIACLLMVSCNVYSAPVKISQEQAASIALQINAGRVLGVKRKGNAYQVKILLSNGEVKITQVNVNSGNVK
ncbi:MAG: PepSY domain-containing protein [Methyloprofundus sp.]|nr:PepSY domain-containing protein [Methyloprofundus sp.]MBW6453183.1 PepSY domain-containing protein [Methyloprofundus sp.]MDF1582983.1 PepSY domain-containing protein [Methyloprofundus sp.]